MRRAWRRGFSIPELLVVMAIIGILSSLSFPKFYNMVRDRRVNRNAMELMNFYRMAKTRALGRGSAVLVRYKNTAANSVALFEMREGVVDSTLTAGLFANGLPTATCSGTTWNNSFQGLAGARAISTRDMGPAASNPGTYVFQGPTALAAQGAALTPQTYVDICFTPRGRTFIRYADATPWFPLTSVPRIDIQNAKLAAVGAGVTRSIYVPPGGLPRMGL